MVLGTLTPWLVYHLDVTKTISFLHPGTMEPCCNLELDMKGQTSKGFSKRRMVTEDIIDETLLKISSKLIWLCAAILLSQKISREILAILQKYQKKENDHCSRKIYCNIGKQTWKLNSING